MALLVQLKITAGGGLHTIQELEIRRLEPLLDRDNPNDEVHTYEGWLYDAGGRRAVKSARLEHRYGDQAWVLVAKMMAALEIDQAVSVGP